MKYIKYTKEILESAVRQNVSIAGVLRALKLKQAGGTHSHISRRIKEFGLDTTHFLGQAANQGNRYKGPRKRGWQEILILRESGRRQRAHVLRRSLLAIGRHHRCEGIGCPLINKWLDHPLVLHVNHKNGNWLDDRPENLEFLCPNCHSQTPNYCRGMRPDELTSVAVWHREYNRRKKGPVAERQTRSA